MRLKHQVSVHPEYHRRMVSGQKIMTDRLDSGLSSPQAEFLEFAPGWRERPVAAMTAAEVDVMFEEYMLLVLCDGAEN